MELELPAESSRRPKRLGVLVLGMHRSGTSAAARLVNLLGFSLGPGDDVFEAREDNPTGFWENAALVRMNDKILAALGGHWSAPPPLVFGWDSRRELDSLRPEAEELLRTTLVDDQWVWKDPRNCLTLPFWSRLVGTQPTAVVFIHRNPLEVAVSLAARDGMTMWLALALWERHIRSALAAVRGSAVYVTSYEQLLREPAEWSERVGNFLRDRGAEIEQAQAADVRSFVRTDLRHSEFGAGELAREPAISEPQRILYADLQRLEGVHSSFTPPELPPETPWAGALFEERRRPQRLEAAAEAAELARRRAESAQRQAESALALIESSRSYRALAPLRSLARFLESHRSQ